MSIYWDVLSAVQATIAAVPGFAGVAVQIRKRPFHSTEHGDPLPFVCLAPSEDRLHSCQFANGLWIDYPVLVALFQRKGATLQTPQEVQWQLDRRQELRDALYRPTLAGAATVFDADYDPSPAFDLAGLDQLYDVSLQRFTFRSSETRAS